MLSAQRTKYLIEADADTGVILRGGRTLQRYRDDFLLPVVFLTEPDRPLTPINGYLYLKAKEHSRILDTRWEACKKQEIEDEVALIDEGHTTHFTPLEGAIDDSPYGFSA